jgi:acyl carrier protein
MSEIAHAADERLLRCFSSVFPDLSEQQIRTASIHSVPAWDSLAAVTLIALLQEEFGLQVDLADYPELTSFEAVRAYLLNRDGKRKPEDSDSTGESVL